MVKNLRKSCNINGNILEKNILELLHMNVDDAFDVLLKDGGIFLKLISSNYLYKNRAKLQRKSLDKFGE